MKNFKEILKSKGLTKKWFLKNKLDMANTTFEYYVKNNRMPQKYIDIIIKELGVTYEELTK